ncbi:hypothetical protein Vadar_026927 [Vaccinium darrowii]|uniref:Uncharacterized protein n=1 Tax=Vaccinium darrowii TaxID=229202 RepID=A0ACB7XCJ3_9ERIC|nr:hypothetical protein Vadar_026927 [Vaccinium darrowii]
MDKRLRTDGLIKALEPDSLLKISKPQPRSLLQLRGKAVQTPAMPMGCIMHQDIPPNNIFMKNAELGDLVRYLLHSRLKVQSNFNLQIHSNHFGGLAVWFYHSTSRRFQMEKGIWVLFLFSDIHQNRKSRGDNPWRPRVPRMGFNPVKGVDFFNPHEMDLSTFQIYSTFKSRVLCEQAQSLATSATPSGQTRFGYHGTIAGYSNSRFILSIRFQRDEPWMSQLATAGCLSLAAQDEETQVPLLLELQVEESKYVFEAKNNSENEAVGALCSRMEDEPYDPTFVY